MLIDLRPSARLPGAITPAVYLCSSARASARGPQLGGDLPAGPQRLRAASRPRPALRGGSRAARGDPVPCARNLVSIGVRVYHGGHCRERPLDGD